MKILYVTNMYPDEKHLHRGIFIKEQIEAYIERFPAEYEIAVIDGTSSRLNYVKSIFKINYLLLRHKYDLIHIHFGLSGIFLLFNPFLKTPTILTLHGSDIQSFKGREGLMQYITRMVAARANKVIILNDRMARILRKMTNKLVRIPCGIDLRVFNEQRSNFSNSFFIGFPSSRNRPVKNYALFAQIIEILRKEGRQIETVEFDGFTRAEVEQALSKIDCLVMTSLSEGSPQIIKEALACKVPIISTKVGDVELLLHNVANCSVINAWAPEPFVEKIKLLMNLKPGARVSNGRERIKDLQLDQESVVNKLNKLYIDLLADKGRQAGPDDFKTPISQQHGKQQKKDPVDLF